jgi:flagellar protein FliS
MDTRLAASAYREATFEHAPPHKIVHLLYEGALKFLDQAAALDPVADESRFCDRLSRAEAIVAELRLSLERDHAPELVDSLQALYHFAEGRIRSAMLERSREPIAAAEDVLRTLLDGWKKVAARAPAETP